MHAHAADVPIVVLSGYDDETAAVKAVQAGARTTWSRARWTTTCWSAPSAMPSSGAGATGRSRPSATPRRSFAPRRRSSSGSTRSARRRSPASTSPRVYPAKDAAGDYFDYISMVDGCLGIVVGDVSSHGMGPALLMSETRACLRTLAQSQCDVGEILTRANRVLAVDTGDFHFVTLALVRLDRRDRSITYASAGQRGYVLRAAGQVTVLDSTSIPLGVEAETVVPPRRRRSCSPETS